MEELKRRLHRIDGRGYKAYKDIRGEYNFGTYTLYIDHVQGDPFASPSRLRVRVPQSVARIPPSLYENESRRMGLEDYVIRQFGYHVERVVKGRRGSGKSGLVAIISCGQEVLKRSAVSVNEQFVEARFVVGLPARGRTVLGRQAESILCQEIPQVVQSSLVYDSLDARQIEQHVNYVEDQEVLRSLLVEKGLVAFIGDGSILPRRSGVDDRPMPCQDAVPFQSPDSLAVTLHRPHGGSIRGMGIPAGVTLVVGGGYHGKSTVLRAIERGVYDHIPEDGREWVVTVDTACKIRSEDGRSVECVDISPFIGTLPGGRSTTSFCTDDASGSTSQAANIIEALEMGSHLLLMDEDTSATNFMIRDRRIQDLVAKDREPITPLVDKVQQLHRDHGVSTIIVLGGSGDYFDLADRVVMMDNYLPREVTSQAREIAQRLPTQRKQEGGGAFGALRDRIPQAAGFDPRRGRREVKIDAKGLRSILFGRTHIDLTYLEQLVDMGQTRAIGDAIYRLVEDYVDGRTALREGIEKMFEDIRERGLDVLAPRRGDLWGHYALPRPMEVAGAINRMRTLRMEMA
jgi:predicted ABC-class ATPase